MNLGHTNSITIEEINELIRKESLWYENDERFVIVEKFESDKQKKGFDINVSGNGTAIRFLNNQGKIHRNNGNPSFISDSMLMWHKNGQFHRKNGKPAVLRKVLLAPRHYSNFVVDGTPVEEYWVNGQLHRDNDLPAVVFSNKDTHSYWLVNGNLHRESGKPSIINGNFLHYHNNGALYKSEIKYNNKLVDWIMKNPFKLSAIFFISIMLLVIFLT
jgi:hypothetical protein